MARPTRCSDADYVYDVLNRAVGRAMLFDKVTDYAAFENVLAEAWERWALRLVAYVIEMERNPLRGDLVQREEAWRWSSLWQPVHITQVPWLSEGPLPLLKHWTKYVNKAVTEAELETLRRSVLRGAPFGDPGWQRQTAAPLRLESSVPGVGRERK